MPPQPRSPTSFPVFLLSTYLWPTHHLFSQPAPRGQGFCLCWSQLCPHLLEQLLTHNRCSRNACRVCEQGNVCDNEVCRTCACVATRMCGFGYGGSWRGQGQHVDMWNIFLMLACARGRDVFPHQTACKCVNPRNEGNGGPCVDPAGPRVGGHKYTPLSEDTCISSPVGAREHVAGAGHVGRPGACGCCVRGVCDTRHCFRRCGQSSEQNPASASGS